jgi:hypothetical protein
MKRELSFSDAYGAPIRDSLIIQIPLLLFSAFVFDGGFMARSCGIAMGASWAFVLLVLFRRPTSPTWFDLKMIRFGYLPLLLLAALVQAI